MIRVTVHLESAVSKDRDKPLAEIVIKNDGTGTEQRGNYFVGSMRRGTKNLQRTAVVKDHPRVSKHVLVLVRKALEEMGY